MSSNRPDLEEIAWTFRRQHTALREVFDDLKNYWNEPNREIAESEYLAPHDQYFNETNAALEKLFESIQQVTQLREAIQTEQQNLFAAQQICSQKRGSATAEASRALSIANGCHNRITNVEVSLAAVERLLNEMTPK